MSAVIDEPGMLVIAEDALGSEEGRDGRDEGVTASEIHDIAAGSRKTWRRIDGEKLNGSTFKGNAHTRRGHANEDDLIAQASYLDGVIVLAPSIALFGNVDSPLHRATPDGLGIHETYGDFGAEAKHHDAKWTRNDIPADHMDQIQWGMHVLDLDWWLYVWGVEGQPGIQHRWVPRDPTRIGQLVAQADEFIAWRAAGAPQIDDIPDDVDDAIAEYARGLALAAEGEQLKKANRAVIDRWAARQASAPGEPLRRSGTRAAVFFEPKPDIDELDEAAWAEAEPESYAEWMNLKQRVLDTASAARLLYTRKKPVAGTFRITPNGATK